MEYVNGYERSIAEFVNTPPKVPVSELRTQKDKVTVEALAVPHAKSAEL